MFHMVCSLYSLEPKKKMHLGIPTSFFGTAPVEHNCYQRRVIHCSWSFWQQLLQNIPAFSIVFLNSDAVVSNQFPVYVSNSKLLVGNSYGSYFNKWNGLKVTHFKINFFFAKVWLFYSKSRVSNHPFARQKFRTVKFTVFTNNKFWSEKAQSKRSDRHG